MEHLKFAEDVYTWLAAMRQRYATCEPLEHARQLELAAQASLIHEELGCSVFSEEFLENRRLAPDDPGFYDHPHALQALADHIVGRQISRSES